MIIFKSVFWCAVMVVSSGCDKAVTGLFQDRAERRRLETAQRLAREDTERLEREKAEQLEYKKVEAEKLMATLPSLVKARVKLLRSKADELTDALKGISDDRRLAEKAVSSIGDMRGLEYMVYSVMTNQDLNVLAVKYMGSDFSALKSEFTEAIRFHKTSHTALTQTLQNNAEDYRGQIKGIDEGVDSANRTAQNAIRATHADSVKRIEELQRRKRFMLEAKVKEDDPRIKALDEQLDIQAQFLKQSGGSAAHMNATVLESSARRKFDRALDEKESKDTAAISESQFKGDLYNAAQVYRGRSVDRLLNAMAAQAAVLSERLCDLETTLETLEESDTRMRMMEYPDLVKLRETVMSDTRDKLGKALTAPVSGL